MTAGAAVHWLTGPTETHKPAGDTTHPLTCPFGAVALLFLVLPKTTNSTARRSSGRGGAGSDGGCETGSSCGGSGWGGGRGGGD